jgi:microsomal epoxide hydrolase
MSAVLWLTLAATVAAQTGRVNIRDGFIATTDGVRLHYLEAGRGTSIVFVPGWMGAAEFWEPQIRHFARSHRVVAVDPRSQGDSTKTSNGNYTERRGQDIKELINRLGLAPAVVVAWSRAVPEVLSLVDQFETAGMRGVVLVDGAIINSPSPEAIARVLVDVKTMQLNRKQVNDQQARTMFRKPHSEDFYQRIVAANLKTPTNTAIVLLLDNLHFDYRAALKKLDRPAMFVGRGENPGIQVEIFKEDQPKGRVEVFRESGHALFLDEPDRFNSVLEDFVSSLPQH